MGIKKIISTVDCQHPTAERGAYLLNMVGAITGAIVQFCDQYITYERCRLIDEDMTSTKGLLLWTATFILVYLTWVPFYTIVPFFVDTKRPSVFTALIVLYGYVYFPSTIMFNVYFTGRFVRLLRMRTGGKALPFNKELRLLVYRSMAHCFTRFVTHFIFVEILFHFIIQYSVYVYHNKLPLYLLYILTSVLTMVLSTINTVVRYKAKLNYYRFSIYKAPFFTVLSRLVTDFDAHITAYFLVSVSDIAGYSRSLQLELC